MSRYQHLEVYQAAYSLLLFCYKMKIKMPQFIKHDLGQNLCHSGLRLVSGIIVVNSYESKVRGLQNLNIEMEKIMTWSRLLIDLNGISTGEFKVLSEKTSDVMKQLNAWLTYEKKMESKKESNKESKIESNKVSSKEAENQKESKLKK